LEPGDLISILKLNESHVAIFGAPGTGKTTLIKAMIAAKPDERILVIDYLGNYRGYTRYHGPFPINPLDFIRPRDMIDVITQAVKATYADMDAPWSPAQQMIVENCFSDDPPEGLAKSKSSWYPAHSIPELIGCVREFPYKSLDDENARKAVSRRIELFDNLLWAGRTHSLLKAWFEGRLNGSLSIDLSGVSLPEAIAYVYALLAIIARGRVVKPSIVVIDEAHYFMRIEGSLFEEAVRVARNLGINIIAITQGFSDVESRPSLLELFKTFIIFPTVTMLFSNGSRMLFDIKPTTFTEPHTGLVIILATNAEFHRRFIPPNARGGPVLSTTIRVEPSRLRPLPNALVVDGVRVGLPAYEGGRVRDYIARNITPLIQAEAGVMVQ
jgi:hypothetical protein